MAKISSGNRSNIKVAIFREKSSILESVSAAMAERRSKVDVSMSAPIIVRRRSKLTDIPLIDAIDNTDRSSIFGYVNISRLIELGAVCFTMENNKDEVVAFVALQDHPNLAVISPADWEEWINKKHRLDKMNANNTLFIHYCCFVNSYYPEFMNGVVQKIYQDYPAIQYVAMLSPPVPKSSALNFAFNRVTRHVEANPEKCYRFYVNNRPAFTNNKVYLRRAHEWENPVTVSLTEKMEIVNIRMGHKRLSEIKVFKEPGRLILIGEGLVHGDLVCLTDNVDYALLTEKFDLESVNGFRTWSHRDTPPLLASSTGVAMETPHHSEVLVTPGDGSNVDIDEDEVGLAAKNAISNTDHTIEEIVMLSGDMNPYVPFERLSVTRNLAEDVTSAKGKITPVARRLPKSNLQTVTKELASPSVELFNMCDVVPLYSDDRKPLYPATFHGVKNAFVIELLVSDLPISLRMEMEYLSKIFDHAPKNKNFCLILLPVRCTPPAILYYFTKLEKLDRNYPVNLYAAHQLAINGRISVRWAWQTDLEDIVAMTDKTLYAHRLQLDAFETLYQPHKQYHKHSILVLTSNDIIVGVAILREGLEVDALRRDFELEELTNLDLHHPSRGHALLKHMMVSPFFKHYHSLFLKDIMRLTRYTSLYYKLYPKDILKQDEAEMSWPSCLADMVPVRPRTWYAQPPQDEEFALFYINKRLSFLKTMVDMRDIVIIGSEEDALAFIERLVYSRRRTFYRFNNVRLITVNSLSTWERDSKFVRTMMPVSVHYNTRRFNSLALRAHIEVVVGSLTGINRETRMVEVNYSTEYHFDYLFLFLGEKFTKPTLQVKKTETPYCKMGSHPPELEEYANTLPQNLILVNHMTDAEQAWKCVKTLSKQNHANSEEYVIVYGFVINAWALLNLFINYLPGHIILFVEHGSQTETGYCVDEFNNLLIYQSCLENVLSAGVKYYKNYEFVSWEIYNNVITQVSFGTKLKTLTFKCSYFFPFSLIGADPMKILAIGNSGLAFDGNLIIDNQFKTNDPRIYAGGRITKYSRRYGMGEAYSHRSYSLREIGAKVAEQFMMDALTEDDEDISTYMGKGKSSFSGKPMDRSPSVVFMKRKIETVQNQVSMVGRKWESGSHCLMPSPLPILSEPLVTSCVLPKNNNYLHIRAPGPAIPMEMMLANKLIKKIMTTGDVMTPNYFRILLDPNGIIFDITCLTKKDIDVESLLPLYGKHESLLNNLSQRYETSLIDDFYEFFKEPWVTVITHDKFKNLLEEIQSVYLKPLPFKDFSFFTMIEETLDLFNTNRFRPNEKRLLKKMMHKYGIEKQVIKYLIEFFETNPELKETYLTPRKVDDWKAKSGQGLNQVIDWPTDKEVDHLTQLFDNTDKVSYNMIKLDEQRKRMLMLKSKTKSCRYASYLRKKLTSQVDSPLSDSSLDSQDAFY